MLGSDDGVDVIVTSFVGEELHVESYAAATIRQVKEHVQIAWELPVMEQRLVVYGVVLEDEQQIGDFAEAANGLLQIQLLRCPPYQFDKKLLHKRAIACDDGSRISHGGQNEYQAGFLSGVLESSQTYFVKFELEDQGGRNMSEMFFGLSPDANRTWSNLKGAYMNRLGLYVDDFGFSVQPSGWQTSVYPQADQRRRAFRGQSACECVLQVDMPHRALRFYDAHAHPIGEVGLWELAHTPVRLSAIVGYPGQSIAVRCADEVWMAAYEGMLQREADVSRAFRALWDGSVASARQP